MNNKKWIVLNMGDELLEHFFELNENQIFSMASSLITKLRTFPGFNEEDKFIFFEFLEHSFVESRLKDDINNYDFPAIEGEIVRNHFKYLSIEEYDRFLFMGEFYELVDSGQPWMFTCFLASIVATTKLSYDKKIEAIEMMFAIMEYTKRSEPYEFVLYAK